MRCPYCKKDNDKVVDSRSAADGHIVRRRRECLDCGKRFTTYEQIDQAPLRVVKKEGVRQAFDRQKILAGLLRACEKRSVAIEVLEEIVSRIESEAGKAFDREVTTKYIGEHVMDELKKLDQVAYVRFASVYRDFKDINDFADELKAIADKARE